MSLPDTLHGVLIQGSTFFVDDGTRKQLEGWMHDADRSETITVDTLLGEELTIARGAIACIFGSSPEIREKDRELGKLFKDETVP